MSDPRATDALLARLAADLAPVRPLPRLRAQALAIAAVWAATAGAVALWAGLHPIANLARGALSAGLAAALAGVGLGALGLALAARIPGREPLARAARALAVLAGLAVLALAFAAPGGAAEARPLAAHGPCALHALLYAVPAGALAALLVLRGAPWRPWTTGLAAAFGAVALGGLLIHLSCPSPDPWHWLVAHALAPLAAGAALGAGAAAALGARDAVA